jgi:ketosteroid isomerase-like protein
MKRNNCIPAFFLIAFSFLAFKCHAQSAEKKVSLEETKIVVEKSNDTYFQAFVKGDSKLLASHYTDNCWIMPSNSPALCGPEAPGDFFQMAYTQAGVRNGKLISIDISGNGEEFVTETGFYYFFNAKNEQIEEGKYLVLWKKTNEGWKMFRNSFSPNHKPK